MSAITLVQARPASVEPRTEDLDPDTQQLVAREWGLDDPTQDLPGLGDLIMGGPPAEDVAAEDLVTPDPVLDDLSTEGTASEDLITDDQIMLDSPVEDLVTEDSVAVEETSEGNKPALTIKQILAQLDGVFPMDPAAVEALPPGETFVSVEHFGTSAWTITGKLISQDRDGSFRNYFLKVAYGETGRIMLGGEFESSKLIYDTMSDFIPEPFGFGEYKTHNPKAYFYLSEFVDMDVTSPPDPGEFTSRLAHLHKISQSPTGKFGFDVPTCDGDRAHVVDWQESWAVFYRNLFLGVCALDIKRNDPWPEFEIAVNQVAWKVIPRLLEPLQAEGREIKPCIIHGDLWEGNMGISKETGDTLLFDAGSYFAHNEMEMGHWRCEFTTVFRSDVYTKHYLLNYPAAEPADEFDDRNRLYSLKGAINYSAGHPGSFLRKTAYNNMCYLCEKYAPIDGIDKYDPQIDPSITGACIVPHLADGLI